MASKGISASFCTVLFVQRRGAVTASRFMENHSNPEREMIF